MSHANANLSKLSKEELHVFLKPFYADMKAQLSYGDFPGRSYESVVQNVFDRLQFSVRRSLSFEQMKLRVREDLSPCATAVGVVVADVLGIALQCCGITQAESRAVTRALLRELGEDTLRGLLANIHNIANAESFTQRCIEIWKLLSATLNVIGLNALLAAIRDSLHWYDVVEASMIVSAQIAVWFASDGLAFIAELALQAVYVAQTVADSVTVVRQCGGPQRNDDPIV